APRRTEPRGTLGSARPALGARSERASARSVRAMGGTAVDQRAIRVCAIGDELVAGVGDPRGLGWLGRVAARTPTPAPLTVLQLAVPGETTAALSQRWDAEVSRRTHPDADN